MDALQPRGVPCPECQARIIVEIGDLLSRGQIRCGSCGLELVMDRDRSAGVIDALERFQAQWRHVEQRAGQAVDGSDGGAVSRRPRRRTRRRSRSRS